jgi:hypothetical protein
MNVIRLSPDEIRGRSKYIIIYTKYIIIHAMLLKRAAVVIVIATKTRSDAGADKSEGHDFELNMLQLL